MKLAVHSNIVKIIFLVLLVVQTSEELRSQNVVPGTGSPIAEVGDDFEDPAWAYQPNLPKAYNDGETTVAKNVPGGVSANGRWYEGSKRGQPDSIRIVQTPADGIAGSTRALAIRSLVTGSTRPTYRQQQDDLISNVAERIGKLPTSMSPSVVTRVWFPPFEQWEQRNDCHFAFRVALETETSAMRTVGYRNPATMQLIDSWPGFFVDLQIKNPQAPLNDPARYRVHMWLKADANGMRIEGPEIKQSGWWTLGISTSPDGQVHYYAKPGIEDLTADDHIASSYPFGQRTVYLRNFFFNVCSGDNGRNWSGEFVIDDPTVFVVK